MATQRRYEALKARIRELEREISDQAPLRQAHQKHRRFLRNMQRIDQAIQSADEINPILDNVIDTVLHIFRCDRAWLFSPCDPDADLFAVSVESTQPEYPGAKALGIEVAMTADMAAYCRQALAGRGQVQVDPPEGEEITNDIALQFNVKSLMFMALHPKMGEPWMFGVHQCDHRRRWSDEEKRLFQAVGFRIADCLSNMHYLRQLERSEERFRRLFEHSNDSVFIHTLDGKIQDVNVRACELLGYAKAELLQLTLLELHPAEVLPECRQAIQTAGQEGSVRFETQFIRADGAVIDVEISSQVVDGQTGLVQGLVRDISARKQAEEVLRMSEEKYRELTENLNDVLYTVGVDGKIEYVSSPVESVLGYRPGDLVGRHFSDIVHPDDLGAIHRAFQDVLQNNLYASQYRIRTKGGDYRWIRTSSRPIMAGGAVAGLQGVLADITEQKAAEEALRESERILDATGRMARVGGWEHDLATGKAVWTKALHDIIGIPYDESPPGVDEHLDYYPERERRILEKAYNRAVNNGTPFDLELQVHTAEGKPLWCRVQGEPVMADGRCVKTRGVFQDITARKGLEENLRQAQKMEAIGTLAGGISHDFNNVLGIIVGNLELASDDVPPENPAHLSLNEARKACSRAKDMVKQILAFSRKDERAYRTIDIQPVIKEALKMLRSSIPSTVEMDQEISTKTAMITGDPTQVHQVLMNLCTNAVDAMEEMGSVLQVRLAEVCLDEEAVKEIPQLSADTYIRLTVSDTGRGIPPDMLNRIFDPYFTTKEVNKGTGLGLSVVHGIVREHGGTVTVYSEEGKGTTFHVFFPVAETVREAEVEERGKDMLGGSERILVVDDEAALAGLAKRILENVGYTVESKTNPIDGLETFRSDPEAFDLVITDMTMPHMTGDILAKELMGIRPDIPVILCTGFSNRVDDRTAAAQGIKGYVMKPLVRSELTDTVRSVLDGPPALLS